MRKLYVLLGTFAFCLLAGCADETNDEILTKTISTLSATTTAVEDITKTLNDGVAKAKQDNKPLDKTVIIEATKKADQLKNFAAELQKRKAESDVARDSVTTDQKQALAKKYKDTFLQALRDLDAAERRLDAALKNADAAAAPEDKMTPTGLTAPSSLMDNLRFKLEEAQREFEVLTKRQG